VAVKHYISVNRPVAKEGFIKPSPSATTRKLCIKKNNQKLDHQTRFSSSNVHKNAFAAGAAPRIRIGELTALPHVPKLNWRS